ncbi:MAG: hypothetical protein LBF59_00110 [Prevotellaceae bacterium]|nr:hypothetical protein [Prevotellaceae bacterium]
MMNKKNLISTLILLMGIMMISVIGRAQDISDSIMSNPLDTIASYDIFDKLSETAGGRVTLGGDDVKSVIDELKTQKSKTLKGWRIRIYRDSNQAASRRAESIKNDIQKTYPGLPVYVTHISPNFYVEVGDYRTRDDAEKMRRTLITAYPAATLLSASINFPPL